MHVRRFSCLRCLVCYTEDKIDARLHKYKTERTHSSNLFSCWPCFYCSTMSKGRGYSPAPYSSPLFLWVSKWMKRQWQMSLTKHVPKLEFKSNLWLNFSLMPRASDCYESRHLNWLPTLWARDLSVARRQLLWIPTTTFGYLMKWTTLRLE